MRRHESAQEARKENDKKQGRMDLIGSADLGAS